MSTRKAESLWAAPLVGELVGTYLLVFFICGSVSAAVLHGAQVGIFQVAIVCGLGVALAIYLTANLSGAHLNPAVSLAAVVFTGFPPAKFLPYVAAQLVGAFLAAATLFVVFDGSIREFETLHDLVRGQPGSEATAMIFGEFYPSPDGKALTTDILETMPLWRAVVVEIVGTAILVLAILGLTDRNNGERPLELAPAMIGLTVAILISVLGPLTMACFNPARDLGPRIFSALAGWGTLPFSVNPWGWLIVYVCAPLAGGLVGGAAWKFILSKFYRTAHDQVI